MLSLKLAVLFSGLAELASAQYSVQDTYSPQNWFQNFQFFTGADPTDGFVDYLDQASAQAEGLIEETSSFAKWGVDSSNITTTGRGSVRLTSNKSYNSGLFILDVAHMPIGCGTWPAYWLVGPDWPNDGEIDIIEGVNQVTTNQMTLHTGPGCSISEGTFSGRLGNTNCEGNQGCDIAASETETYGAGLNSIDGGVFATEWTADGISIWFFPRSSIPSDVSDGSPNPSSWGTPLAAFGGSCSFGGVGSNFQQMQIVFDTTFCGQWADAPGVFEQTCPSQGSCTNYVGENPEAFVDAYWQVNSLIVYSATGSSSGSRQPLAASPSPELPVGGGLINTTAALMPSTPVTNFAPAPTPALSTAFSPDTTPTPSTPAFSPSNAALSTPAIIAGLDTIPIVQPSVAAVTPSSSSTYWLTAITNIPDNPAATTLLSAASAQPTPIFTDSLAASALGETNFAAAPAISSVAATTTCEEHEVIQSAIPGAEPSPYNVLSEESDGVVIDEWYPRYSRHARHHIMRARKL